MQQTFTTCSTLTIEILEKGVKYVFKLTLKSLERRQRRLFGVHL